MRESTPVPLCHNVFHALLKALLKALSSFQPVPGAVFLRNSKMPMREQTKNGDGTTFGFGQQLMRLFVYQKTYIYINTYLKSITQ